MFCCDKFKPLFEIYFWVGCCGPGLERALSPVDHEFEGLTDGLLIRWGDQEALAVHVGLTRASSVPQRALRGSTVRIQPELKKSCPRHSCSDRSLLPILAASVHGGIVGEASKTNTSCPNLEGRWATRSCVVRRHYSALPCKRLHILKNKRNQKSYL